VAIVPLQAFADSSSGGIVERHLQFIVLNLPLSLAAVSCTRRWNLGAEINKQLQLLFAMTLKLTLSHSDVIVV